MRRILVAAPLALALAACAPTAGTPETSSPAPSSAAADAQEWRTHEARDFGIRFQAPEAWTVRTEPDRDAPTLTATSPDGSAQFVVMAFGPEGDALEDLLTDGFHELGSQRTGEVREVALEGMRAWMAEGRGDIRGVETALWVMAARQREANEHYLVFAATPAGRWTQDAALLRRMMESLATLSPASSFTAADVREWRTHEARDFGIRFQAPEAWTVRTAPDRDPPTLMAASPDGSARFGVMAFGPQDDALEDLLTDAFDELRSERTGEAREVALEGMRAWMAEGRGNIRGVETALWVMAARRREANEHYLVFAATPAGRWAQDAAPLRRMMESVATLQR
ncbi:MAG TPA: hypothetical protein VHG08_07185 [Longimicrobium sp.]|nr:hypothetical protein [Longimicrobium sp.]